MKQYINKLLLGECQDIIKDIPDESVDLVFTDPPYSTALVDIHKEWKAHEIDWHFLGKQFQRILKPNGQLAFFCDVQTMVTIFSGLSDFFRFRFSWTWIKSNGQPVSTGRQPRNNTESIIVLAHKKSLTKDLTWNPIYETGKAYIKKHKAGNLTRKMDKDYVTISDGKRFPVQTLYYPSKDNLPKKERFEHPTQKALELCGYVIQSLSNEGDVCFDPFSGSGSIPVASVRYRRNFIAVENNLEYFNMADKRIKNEQSKLTLF